MEEPDITCVIPTYNDRVNLPRAIRSALMQEGVKVEVLLVDDYSDSATREFITALADSDARIRTFFMPANGGQGQARNVGATLASGRFLAFLDQDDEHAPGWYRTGIDLLEGNARIGVVSGRASIIDIPPRFGIDDTELRLRGLTNVFVTNMIFRKSVFMATGGFPTGKVWRSRVAGEDGIYRNGLAANWGAGQCEAPAVIHRAKEGGATVFFLDRSIVENDRVVLTRFDELETNGALDGARREFLERFRQIALEVSRSSPPAD